MTSAKERFEEWWPMRNSDDSDEAFEAGYAAGAEDMRNRKEGREHAREDPGRGETPGQADP